MQGLARRTLFFVIVMVVALAIFATSVIFFQGGTESFKTNMTIRTACQTWDCSKNIPPKLYEKCKTRVECVCMCKDMGARMIQCPPNILRVC